MTKKKILSIVLGVVICFNVCFSRPQRVEADPITIAAVAIVAMLFSAVTASVFIDNNAASAGVGADEFVAWLQEHHANMISYVEEKSANGFLKSDVYSFLIDKSFMIDFIQCVHEFLSTKGDFSSEGYTYSSGDSVANGNLQQYIDFFAPIVSETLGISIDSARYWVQDWGPIKRASEPLYITFCREDFYGNNPIIGFTIHYSSTGYMDFNNNQTINSEYPTFWVDTFGGGVSYSYNTVFNGTSPFTPYDPVSYFYYTPGLEGTSSSVTSTAELTADGQAFASDPEAYAEDFANVNSGTTVVHYPDDTSEVDTDSSLLSYPVVDSGSGDYSLDTSIDWTIDDAFSKPATDTYVDETPTVVDSPTTVAGTLVDWLDTFWKKLLKLLGDIFIPDISCIVDLRPQFEDKFSFVPQIEEIWNNFLNGNFGGNRPDFKITIPASFLHSDSDKECIIIDFSLFDQYRTILHDIIILLAYLAFGRRLLVSLPTLLGYSSGSSGHAVIINNNTVRNSYNRYDYMGD